jgi:putative glutamine amidotransferase
MTVIGLTTYSEPAAMLVWQREFAMLHATYVAATERAGGTAVLLPPQGAGAAEVLDRVDGLVLTGGADVDPRRYGQAPGISTSRPRELRDEWETVDVTTEPGSRTAGLIGARVRVHCHHHQAVDRLAGGLTVTGRADDGTVEAVEVPGPAFAVGVQWHPEENSEDIRLLAALVAAGHQYRERLSEGGS